MMDLSSDTDTILEPVALYFTPHTWHEQKRKKELGIHQALQLNYKSVLSSKTPRI